MKEQDFFDIMDGLPERQIAEAAEWKYRHGEQQENEIDALLKSSTVSEPVRMQHTEPDVRSTAAEPIKVHGTSGGEKQSRIIRSGTLGLAAVAAAFALIVGGIGLKLHRDNIDVSASVPGTTISDEDLSMTEISGSTVTEVPVYGSTAQTTSGTTVTFEKAEAAVPYTEDNTVSAGEENFLGGTGPLRIISSNETGGFPVFQDDNYIYLGGGRRILKENLEPNNCDAELVCQKAGCDHYSEDCPLYYEQNGGLICRDGQNFYIRDWGTLSPKQGFAGGLKRILSDGSTEDVFPLKKIGATEEIGIVSYPNVMRLGDTGIYFLEMYCMPYEHNGPYVSTSADSSFFETVLLDSRTGETIPFEYLNEDRIRNMLKLQFDEASGHLFISYGVMDRVDSVMEIDIYTGNLLCTYVMPDKNIINWAFAEGKLHFLASDNARNGKITWYCEDAESGTIETVLEDCKLRTLFCHDGRMYALRHESVGMDAILSYALDGTDEQLIAETNNSLEALAAVYDPERIVATTNTGACYMTDPEKGLVRLNL